MEREFVQAIEENQAIIHKICRIYRDRPEDREDLFQEIVFQCWRAYPKFQGRSKFSSWLYRIALNTAMASYRKQSPPIDLHGSLPDRLHPMAAEETSENEERLFQALRQLKDSEKAIVSLYLEGFNYREMAEITGLTENNIGVRLNRIKHKLKQILNPKASKQ